MKAKINKVIIITVVAIMSTITFIYGQKDLPFDYYPPEYNNLTSKNWNEIKMKLDNFLNFQDFDTIGKMEKPSEARFLLTKIAFIDWNSSQKAEVISYLENFSESMLHEKSFIKNISTIDISKTPSINNPIFLPHRAVWTIIQLDENAAGIFVQKLFKNIFCLQNNNYINKIRELTIESLSEKYKSESIISCLETIENMPTIVLTNFEKETISKVFFEHDLYKLDDQQKAWQYIWDRNEKKELKEIIKRNNQSIFNRNVFYMKEIYGDSDLSLIVQLSEETPIVAKKYFFLYAACYIMNGKLSRPETDIDKIIIDKLVNNIQNIYHNEDLTAAIKNQQGIDFLNETFTITKVYLENRKN